jgi:hypothetical protein
MRGIVLRAGVATTCAAAAIARVPSATTAAPGFAGADGPALGIRHPPARAGGGDADEPTGAMADVAGSSASTDLNTLLEEHARRRPRKIVIERRRCSRTAGRGSPPSRCRPPSWSSTPSPRTSNGKIDRAARAALWERRAVRRSNIVEPWELSR